MSDRGFRRPDHVAMVDDNQQPNQDAPFYLAQLPHGPLVVLAGTASTIWSEALTGDEKYLVDRVAQRVGVPALEIRKEVVAFVAALVDQGFLERLDSLGCGEDNTGEEP